MKRSPAALWFPFLLLFLESWGIYSGFLSGKALDTSYDHNFPSPGLEALGGISALVLFALLLLAEVFFARKITREKLGSIVTPLLLTHLPWALNFLTAWFCQVTLPAPHDLLERKLDILFGLMWCTHLFLFSGWLLWRTKGDKGSVSRKFGWVAAFFFLGVTLSTVACDLSGDEPHYLLMVHSLIHDRDLNLLNNYGNSDYIEFYHRGELVPQGLEHITASSIYSHHPLGPALLVLPGYLILGRLGAALSMALLAALALFLTLRAMEVNGAKGWPLQAVGAIGLFSSPFLLFAGLVYPEIPTACLVAASLLLFLKKRWGWFGLTQGLMLWMHNRNVLLVIPFLLSAAYAIWKDRKGWKGKGRRLAAGLGIPLLLLSVYFHVLYGVWTPLGAHNEPFTSLFRLGHFWDGFFGLILDQECGLWFHFPVFAMAFTGGVVLFRSKARAGSAAVGVFVFFYLFMSFYENLGLTPATRYMVGVTPLLLLMLYPVLDKMKKWDIWVALTLVPFLLGVLVNWVLAAIPWMRYNKLEGENWILKIAGNYLGLPLPSWEPSYQGPMIHSQSYFLGAFWVIVTVVLTALFLRDKVVKHH